MEIYNERIRDLLSRDKDNVKIREGANGVYLEEVEQLRSQTPKGRHLDLSQGPQLPSMVWQEVR